jgi:hypothetical protein
VIKNKYKHKPGQDRALRKENVELRISPRKNPAMYKLPCTGNIKLETNRYNENFLIANTK